MTDIEARDWYNGEVAKLDAVEAQMRADGKPSDEIYSTLSPLRNDLKMQARDLMQDQELAESLPPPRSPDDVLQKYNGDYEAAIAASKRINPDANRQIEDRRSKGER